MWRGKALSHGVNLGRADKDDHGLHRWVRIKRRRRQGFCLLVFPIREIRTAISQNRRRLRKIFSRRAFCDGTADNADERRYFEATTSRALISAIRGVTSGFIGGTAADDSFPAKLGKFKIEKQRQL
jgi:hypothetical protein